uniref:F-box domain-containing protein n=1 Tax=Oryza meridionalis TaxID=40149 RepID=A0A0E0FCU5_9ORYZ
MGHVGNSRLAALEGGERVIRALEPAPHLGRPAKGGEHKHQERRSTTVQRNGMIGRNPERKWSEAPVVVAEEEGDPPVAEEEDEEEGVDFISDLPDAILDEIIVRLPTKEANCTQVLAALMLHTAQPRLLSSPREKGCPRWLRFRIPS